jgi:hypothetical protein
VTEPQARSFKPVWSSVTSGDVTAVHVLPFHRSTALSYTLAGQVSCDRVPVQDVAVGQLKAENDPAGAAMASHFEPFHLSAASLPDHEPVATQAYALVQPT